MTNSKKLRARAERLVFIVPEVLKKLFQGPQDLKDNIPHSQIKVLHTLSFKGQCNMSELAGSLSVEMSSVTVVIDALVKSGLVARVRDKQDRRVVLVDLSKKGKDMFKKLTEHLKKNIANKFSKMPEQKQLQIITAFEQVYKIFEEKEK